MRGLMQMAWGFRVHMSHTWRLLCSSFLVMTCLLILDYKYYPKREYIRFSRQPCINKRGNLEKAKNAFGCHGRSSALSAQPLSTTVDLWRLR